ncbi:GNAT family N-acetyltransferase [Halalkalibacter okhensis]|uniref:Alanine acetyltransferase n=1 Tax=Halalkalibacter okhensis TaxID=333138 RepID=A0A0B0IDA0_9BACI|nr:GNAT family protein [Halalkalibacter okhensis]KHF39265.1 alanine acetyltransferase [Halalkalibacter okhensis]
MLSSTNIFLRPFHVTDANDLLQLQLQNKEFFEPFAMVRSDTYYTLIQQQKYIQKWKENMENDLEYQFGIYHHAHTLIGTISLFQIMRGSLQSAFIGYFLGREYNGRGYGTEAVKLMVDYAFNQLELHRIEAGVMPHNIGSIRVLEKAGFHKEGVAIQNVKINGTWEDHQVLAIINPKDFQ